MLCGKHKQDESNNNSSVILSKPQYTVEAQQNPLPSIKQQDTYQSNDITPSYTIHQIRIV